MHPNLVTPWAQDLKATLWITHLPDTPPKPFPIVPGICQEGDWGTAHYRAVNIISTVSNPNWPPGNFVICTGMEFIGDGCRSPTLWNTNPGMMRPICLTHFNCPQAAEAWELLKSAVGLIKARASPSTLKWPLQSHHKGRTKLCYSANVYGSWKWFHSRMEIGLRKGQLKRSNMVWGVLVNLWPDNNSYIEFYPISELLSPTISACGISSVVKSTLRSLLGK